MRREFRVSLLLVFLLVSFTLVGLQPGTIDLVRADPGPAVYKWAARPSSHSTNISVISNPTHAYDEDTGTFTSINYGKGDGKDRTDYELITFKIPPTSGFSSWNTTPAISTVDFKMKYEADANTKDEKYQIEYSVGTAGPEVLQAWTGDAYTLATRVWSSQPEPNDGTWSWTEVTDIKFRVLVSPKGGSSEDSFFDEYEAWVEVSIDLPPPKMRIDPQYTPAESAGETFYIDVNITDVAALWGYEFNITYDTTVLTATSYSTYPPFWIPQPSRINDTAGWVAVANSMSYGEAEGCWGSGKLGRVNFQVDSDGGKGSLLGLTQTRLSSIYGVPITHNAFDGVYGTAVPEFPLGMAIELALIVAIAYVWWRRRSKTKLPKQTNGPLSR